VWLTRASTTSAEVILITDLVARGRPSRACVRSGELQEPGCSQRSGGQRVDVEVLAGGHEVQRAGHGQAGCDEHRTTGANRLSSALGADQVFRHLDPPRGVGRGGSAPDGTGLVDP
jgi:hypothetical protein